MIDGATPMAPLVEQLGVTASNLEDGDQVISMVLVCKVHNFKTGGTSVAAYTSDGLDWVDKWGMIGAAYALARSGIGGCAGEDGE
jgi:hypothetical protein